MVFAWMVLMVTLEQGLGKKGKGEKGKERIGKH
jgi:hypothetical protein